MNTTYWHNWSDINGTSHITQCQFTNFSSNNVTASNTPLFGINFGMSSDTFISILPIGFNQTWHVNPVRQLIYCLSGIGKFVAMDNSEIILTPGVIYFGDDKKSIMGHKTYNLGNESLIMALVQFSQWNQTNNVNQFKPCWLN